MRNQPTEHPSGGTTGVDTRTFESTRPGTVFGRRLSICIAHMVTSLQTPYRGNQKATYDEDSTGLCHSCASVIHGCRMSGSATIYAFDSAVHGLVGHTLDALTVNLFFSSCGANKGVPSRATTR